MLGRRKLNSLTYANHSPAERWSKEETEKYYKALTMFGLDFTMIGYHFPNRNRRQLKNKYKAENQRNPARVDQALSSKVSVAAWVHDPAAVRKCSARLSLGIHETDWGLDALD
jgi:hypothetical protein